MAPSIIEAVKSEPVKVAPQPVISEQEQVAAVSSAPINDTDKSGIVSEEEAAYAEIAEAVRQEFSQTKVSFSGDANKIQFTIVDEKTGEVVRSFPEKGKGGILAKKA